MKGYIWLLLLTVTLVAATPLGMVNTAPPQPTLPTNPSETPVSTAEFQVKNTKTGEILHMSEEEFLIAVLSCEMAPSSPTEALKAQTVAAYTYYCKQRAASTNQVFSNVPETLFTVGTAQGMRERFGKDYDKWYGVLRDAVRAVQGEQLQFDGQPITACYHAISAGLTESATDVWGGNYPYLMPVDSAGDLSAEGYLSTVTFTAEQLTELLKKSNAAFSPTDTPATWFGSPTTTDSGFVKEISICGSVFNGTTLRTALGLRSAAFTVAFADEKFTFTVRGYGHNVGMSQTGAKYMANQGADYKEILAHYYPHTTLVDITEK